MFERLQPQQLIRGHELAFAAAAVWVALSLQPARAQVAPANTALPTGASVAAGSAHVVTGGTAAAPVMTVNQSSDRAIVNWNTFNIGRDASVVFQQPTSSSVILNRVLDMSPSQLFGHMQSNGQVFLLNPAGVWFGPTSSVDVGALVATTHSMSNSDFMAGTYRFERNGATGSVVNGGSIEAKLGGYIALLAPEVRNDGVLLAKSGTIALAAGETVTMNVNPATSKVDLLVTSSTVNALIENKKIVKAPDGNVIMSAQAYNELASGVIKNSGEIVAAGITKVGGRIVLGASTEIANSGSIDASSAVAKGGSVTLDADQVTHSGVINVESTAVNGKGGEAVVTGNAIYIESGAKITATGNAGGGSVLVGGDWQGGNGLRQAIQTVMDKGAVIDASAIVRGNGGKIVLWSDVDNLNGHTQASGTLLAKAGAQGGNGGQIETSGHKLDVEGARIDTDSPTGNAGLWLIDPYDISIGTTASGTAFSASGTDYLYTSAAGSYITASAIVSALTSSNVTIQTGLGGTGYGDILLNTALSYSGANDRTLTLKAARNVFLNDTITSTGGRLHLNVYSDFDANSSGDQIRVGNNITTNGGNILLSGENIVFQGTTGQTISTARTGVTGGSLTVNGSSFLAVYDGSNPAALNINTGGGDVTFNGTIDTATDVLFQRIFDVSSDSNFDSLATTYGFNQISGASTNSFFENQRAFGLFSNQSIDLGFSNLNNSAVGLKFNFYAIDSWDGVGADSFNVKVSSNGGASFIDLFTLRPSWNATFSNTSGTVSGYSYAVTLKQEGNVYGSNRGNFDQFDRRIGISITTPQVSSIILRMTGALDSDVVDESWAVNAFTLSNSQTSYSGNGALTINAGSGNVTFGGAVGMTKTLTDLSVTAGNMIVNSTNTLNVSNDMLIDSNITKNAGSDSTMTFKAGRHLSFGADRNISSTSNKLNLVFNADTDKSGDGFIKFSSNINSTNGGSIQFGVGDQATLNGATVFVGGDVYFDGTNAQTIDSGAGSITVNGETLIANTAGVTINSTGGLTFKGSVNSSNQYVGVSSDSALSWIQADAAAVAAGGYLATITSRLENSVAALAGKYTTSWIGGRRLANGTWRWERGPEAGQTFTYTNWAAGEPNNCCTTYTNGLGFAGENATQFTGSNGNWNDLFDNGSAGQTLNNYIRETTINSAPLTLNAGTGSINFNSAVGTSKEISTLSITAGALTGSTIKTSSALKITNTTPMAVSAVVTGAGGLTKEGSGTLTLTGTNTYTGDTTINAGTLNVGAGGTTGTLGTGNVVNNAALVFNRSDTYVLPGIVSGAGTLTKQGTGLFGLAGANTYSGATTLSAGSLGIYNNSALGTSTVTAAGSTSVLFGRSVTSVANNFVLNGSVTFDLDTAVDYLIVGGGGGGGSWVGGGGGGGGVLSGSIDPSTDTSMAITVGAGGAGARFPTSGVVIAGSNGSSSSLTSTSVNLQAYGGGVGASWNTQVVNYGSTTVGSGGGGSGSPVAGGSGTNGQGYAGGGGNGTQPHAAGGGGGAGGAGGDGIETANTNTGAVGGAGGIGVTSSITGSSQYYGGGGGGGVHGANQSFTGALGGSGGLGGGGNGTPATTSTAFAAVTAGSGTANTGGGGGGSGGAYGLIDSLGGNGGSGIVIVRYAGGTAGTGGTRSSGSGTASGYTLHTFTSTGSGTLALNAVAVNLTGAISGTGSMTANATGGTLKFSGNSSYTGTTTISGGVVQTNNLNAFGNNSALTINNVVGAQMQLLNSLNVGSLAGGGASGGNVLLNTGTVLNAGANNTNTSYAGVMSGAGGFTKSGSGTFTLTGANTFSGDATISAGTLQIGSGGTAGTLGTGNVIDNSSLVYNRSDSAIMSNLISGSGNIVKQGAGTLSLLGANTYSGGTTLSAGGLGVYNNTALGTGTVTAQATTSLLFGRTVSSVANNVTLNGAVTFDLDDTLDYLIVGGGGGGGTRHAGGGGAGGVLTGSTSFAGGTYNIAVGVGGSGAGSCNNSAYTSCAAPTAGSNSSIAGTDFTTMTAFGGGAGYSLNVSASAINGGSGGGGQGSNPSGTGTAGQGNNGGAGSTGGGNANWTGGGGGGAGAVGGNGSSAGIAGSGGIGIASSITGTSVYYGGGGGGSAYVGYTGGAGGAGGGGAGGPGSNGAAGATNTGGGGGAGGFDASNWNYVGGAGGSGTVIVRYVGSSAGSGGSSASGTGTATGYTLHTFNSTGNSTLTLNPIAVQLSGTISGTGSMTANATGGTMKFSGANSYTGTTAITGGVVQTSALTALGNNSALTLSNIAGAQLQLQGNLSIGSLTGGGTSGGNVLLNTGYVLNAGANNSSTTYAGVMSGAGGFTKSGTGTLTLTNNSTYSGDITIGGGALQVGSGSTIGSLGTGNIIDNASLIFNRSDNLLISNLISGTGNIVKLGAGAVSLTRANSYSGGTILSAGTLGVYDNSALGTGTVTAASGTNLLFGRAVTAFANNVTLNGSVGFSFDTSVDYLAVGAGGGGGGGGYMGFTPYLGGGGGGGGGGQVATGSAVLAQSSYAITVGDGGAGATGGVSGGNWGGSAPGNGGASIIAGVASAAGGFGAAMTSTNAVSGWTDGTGGIGGNSGAGFAGGAKSSSTSGGAGGGGAGAGGAGVAASGTGAGGAGGVGVASSISGSSITYGAGGTGAAGGGSNVAGAAGTANTGAGGTGGGGNNSSSGTAKSGGSGGSGLVIVRYLGGTAGSGGTVATGSGTASGYTLHTFNGSSTLTLNPISLLLSGTLNGSGSMTANATGGTMKFSGSNSYTGSTSITGGLVQTSALTALGNSSALTISNVAGAQLQLLNNLTIGSLAGSGATGGNIALGSYALTAGGNNTSTSYGGVISGTGTFTKAARAH